MGGILRSGMLGAVVAGAVAAPILHATGAIAARRRDEIERHNDDRPVSEWMRPGDKPLDDLDGAVRGGAIAASGVTLLLSGVAALRRSGRFAARGVGVATALLGTAALSGSGSVTDRLQANGLSVGSAVVGITRDRHRPQRPDVEAAQPTGTAEVITGSERPTKQEILDAKLPLPAKPDEKLAQANAAKAIKALEHGKPDIMLWLPGTYEHYLHAKWSDALDAELQRGSTTALIDYPANLDFEESVATGMRTLQLVLAEVADMGRDDRRVFVGGYSQGGWVAGDLMDVPEIRDSIDRAVFFGHPGLAKRHRHDGSDPKVMEVNDGADPVAAPVKDRDAVLATTEGLEHRDVYERPIEAIKTAATSPELSEYMVTRVIDPPRWARVDPHEYSGSYAEAAAWLDETPIPES